MAISAVCAPKTRLFADCQSGMGVPACVGSVFTARRCRLRPISEHGNLGSKKFARDLPFLPPNCGEERGNVQMYDSRRVAKQRCNKAIRERLGLLLVSLALYARLPFCSSCSDPRLTLGQQSMQRRQNSNSPAVRSQTYLIAFSAMFHALLSLRAPSMARSLPTWRRSSRAAQGTPSKLTASVVLRTCCQMVGSWCV